MLGRGRVLLFSLPNRGPKEDGVREAKASFDKEPGMASWLWVRGSGRLPCFVAPPGTVKSFTRTARGTNSKSPDRQFRAPDYL